MSFAVTCATVNCVTKSFLVTVHFRHAHIYIYTHIYYICYYMIFVFFITYCFITITNTPLTFITDWMEFVVNINCRRTNHWRNAILLVCFIYEDIYKLYLHFFILVYIFILYINRYLYTNIYILLCRLVYKIVGFRNRFNAFAYVFVFVFI